MCPTWIRSVYSSRHSTELPEIWWVSTIVFSWAILSMCLFMSVASTFVNKYLLLIRIDLQYYLLLWSITERMHLFLSLLLLFFYYYYYNYYCYYYYYYYYYFHIIIIYSTHQHKACRLENLVRKSKMTAMVVLFSSEANMFWKDNALSLCTAVDRHWYK